MALLSFAGSPHGGIHKLLPEWQSQPRIRPVGLVKHTIVGSAAGAFAYFRDLTGVEAHFILPKTGVIWQCMDTDRTADAQVAGNYWTTGGVAYGYLSIETEDDGDPEHDPWTPAQLDSITWLDNKLAGMYGWARQQTTAPDGITVPRGGSGHHSMWGINTKTSKPNPWTTANGKTCPATPRIAQQKTILLPAYIAGQPPPPALDTLEEIMALYDTKADFEAGMTKAFLAALDQRLGRMVMALDGRPNQVFFGDTVAQKPAQVVDALEQIEANTAPTPPPPPPAPEA